MDSSFQVSAPGSLTSPAPMWRRGCHTAAAAPEGSANTAMRPTSSTSIGSTKTMPPAALTLAMLASASVTET